jgi:hypothetical protein
MKRLLTSVEQFALADVVEDPDAWWDKSQDWSIARYTTIDVVEAGLIKKIENHAGVYAARLAAGSYRNAAQRKADDIAAEVARLNARPSSEKRREAYNAAGLTVEDLSVLLWERDVENQPGAQGRIDAAQVQRVAIKGMYP